MHRTQPARVRFGIFELDLQSGELHVAVAGDPEPRNRLILQQQPFRLLAMLVGREGAMVSREEIKKQFWPNDTIVEFDHSINVAIGKLRKALGDSAEDPQYIETLARRGYRLMVPVEWVVPEDLPGQEDAHGAGDALRLVPPLPDLGALAGRTVSHYRVLNIIGGGGMGVVYGAEDLRLGRRVALKFLPEELGKDPHALERFRREARAISSLDHPNICTIHEFGEHEGRPFMVMQLLEGQTLRERLTASAGSLPPAELLDIGLQINHGLQAAHERGIIHRDIKPANIFLTKKGVSKILDFGVAKLLEMSDEDECLGQPETPPVALPTAPVGLALTRTGLAMGTAGYMSPEQARGEKLDARTDLFSFGLVLYEMATGQRAFRGQTAEMVGDATLHQLPIPIHDLNSKLSPKLESIVNKALEKHREARYQTAAEMGDDLRRLHSGSHVMAKTPARYQRALLSTAALLVLGTLGLWWRWFSPQPMAHPKMLSERLLTHNPSENRLIGAFLSPDGKYVAYTDTKGLHVSIIATGEVHNVPLPEDLQSHLWAVTWSPDGEKLLFSASSDSEGLAIWVTSVFGGGLRKLQNDGGLWAVTSPRDSSVALVAAKGHEIRSMGINGESPHKILSGENETYQALAWSPTGQRLAYIKAISQTDRSIETVSLDGGAPSVVLSDPQPGVGSGLNLFLAQDGRIIFTVDEGTDQYGSNLWGITTDPRTGKPSGKATKLTNWDGIHAYSISASADAKLLALVKTHDRNDVYVAELVDGGTRLDSPTRITVDESDNYVSGWMTDNKTLLFKSNRTGRDQLFAQRTTDDTAEPLGNSMKDEDGPGLTPDGRWILYWSAASPDNKSSATKQLMRFPASGGSPEQVLEVRRDDAAGFDCPTHTRSFCVLSHWEQGRLIFYALDPVRGRGKELVRTKLALPTDLSQSISPDGSRIALASQDQFHEQIRILDSTNGTERALQLPGGWGIWSLAWTADGSGLIAAAQSKAGYFLARIDLNGKIRSLLDVGRNHWLGNTVLSPDGRHLAFTQQTQESNAWLLENF